MKQIILVAFLVKYTYICDSLSCLTSCYLNLTLNPSVSLVTLSCPDNWAETCVSMGEVDIEGFDLCPPHMIPEGHTWLNCSINLGTDKSSFIVWLSAWCLHVHVVTTWVGRITYNVYALEEWAFSVKVSEDKYFNLVLLCQQLI